MNARRGLVTRILCESLDHEQITFATLTVDSNKLGDTNRHLDSSLDKSFVQAWLNRFRMRVSPTRIRYFLVGEYGENLKRPHYHALLFGWPSCPYGGSRPIVYRSSGRQCRCEVCVPVLDTWGVGEVTLDSFSVDAASYVAGYVVDKLSEDVRYPSFRLNSDGLGASIVPYIVSNPDFLRSSLDTSTIVIGGKRWPLSVYLRRKIADAVHKKLQFSEKEIKARQIEKAFERMQLSFEKTAALRKEAHDNGKLSSFEICKYELDKKNTVYQNKLARNKLFRKDIKKL